MHDADAIMGSQVWNCENAFEAPCPREWFELTETGESSIRYCDECKKNVYLCETAREFLDRGNAGQCVAVPIESAPFQLDSAMLGRPSAETVRRMEQKKADCRTWWEEVFKAKPTFQSEEMDVLKGEMMRIDELHKSLSRDQSP